VILGGYIGNYINAQERATYQRFKVEDNFKKVGLDLNKIKNIKNRR